MKERRGGEGALCLQRAVQMASSPSSKTQTGGMGARDVAHAHSGTDDVLVHRYAVHDSCTLTTCYQLAFNLRSAASFFQGTEHRHEGFISTSTEIIAVLSSLTPCHNG